MENMCFEYINFPQPSVHQRPQGTAVITHASVSKPCNFDDVIREYHPQTHGAIPLLKVNGVNLLNRTNVESEELLKRLQRRKERHNKVERHRRTRINHAMDELASLIPRQTPTGQPAPPPNRTALVGHAIDYIKSLEAENSRLRAMLSSQQSSP